MIEVSRTGVSIPEFRPGIDNINVLWDGTFVAGYAVFKFSWDGGDTWIDITSIISSNTGRVHITTNAYAFVAPTGRATVNAVLQIDMYDAASAGNLLRTDQTESYFSVAPWSQSLVTKIFPENVVLKDCTERTMVLVGMGDKRSVPNGYPFRINSEAVLKSLFPPACSLSKAWYMAREAGAQDFIMIRAGDYNDWLSIGEGSPRAFQYIYDNLAAVYGMMGRVPAGIICPVDAVADYESEIGLENKLGIQLADFCWEQTQYIYPIVGVIAATTPKREHELNIVYNRKDLDITTGCPVRLNQLRGSAAARWSATTTPIYEIGIGEASYGTLQGAGLISYDKSAQTLQWAEYGASFGDPVSVTAGGPFTLTSSSGATLQVSLAALPILDAVADVDIDYYTEHPGAKFVYPIYGHTNVRYNDVITGALYMAEMPLAVAAATTISLLNPEEDPLNKAIMGLEDTTVLFENYIKVLTAGGVNSIRKTISKGDTLASGVTCAPMSSNPGWAHVKHVRVMAEIVSSIRRQVQASFFGKMNVAISQVEAVAKMAASRYVDRTITWFSLAATRTSPYEAEIALEARPFGTLENITMVIGVGI